MVPLDPTAAAQVRSWVGAPDGRGVLDLHHALARPQGGLWGDEARGPRSVLLVREGAGRLEAFGAGEPGPAVSWLIGMPARAVALLAPPEWWDAVESRFAVERVEMRVLSAGADEFRPVKSAVATRRLTLEDAGAMLASEATPDWALRCWGRFEALIAHGAAFGAPFGSGFASVAWVYSQAGRYEAVGVSTAARFRGLGLGRAVASVLVADIVEARRKVALWTTAPGNAASLATGRSLGFVEAGTETHLRWRPLSRAH